MARDLTFKLILDSLGFQRGAKAAGDALSKLGKDVKQVSGEMKPLAEGMDWFGGIAAKLTSPVGMATVAIGALGAGAIAAARGVAQLAKEAEALQNAAIKTGMGTDALQRYQRTAQNMGASLEMVTNGINKMQRSLELNSKALVAAGLELSKIKGLAPEDQFQEIARQIAAMETPSQRTAAAMVAFGRSGAELLPVLMKIGTEGTDAIVTMSDQQVKALTEVDDALDNIKGSWTDLTNQMLAKIGLLGGTGGLNILADGFRGIAQYIKETQFAGENLWQSSFIKDIMGGTLLSKMVGAAGRANLPQGSAKNWGASSIFQPSTGLGLMDPMAAWTEMVRDQGPVFEALTKSEKELGDRRKELERINSMIVDQLIEDMAKLQYTLPNREWKTGALAAAVPAGSAPMFGGNWDFSKFDNELTKTNNVLDGVTDTTVDWSGNLTALATQLQLLGDVTGGLTGKIAQFAAALVSGIGGLIAGIQAYQKGSKQGGLMGTLGQVVGVVGIAASAIGLGKSIINLFKGDPVKKAQKEAGKALGFNISKEMAEQFVQTAKEQGKSVAAVAKEWLAAQQEALRTEGMAQARSGVEGLVAAMGASPEIAEIAAKNFATLFFETVKDEGWVAASEAFSDIFEKLRAFYGENMPASLQGVAHMMSLASNPNVAPYLQASQAQAQFVSGAMQAGFVSAGMQGDSITIARQTLANLKENGATDSEGYQAIAGLLQSNVNAAVASGQGISAELQALLDEAKANGVDIVADINVQQLDVLRAIYRQLGGEGTATTGSTTGGVTGTNGEGDVPQYASGGLINAGTGRLAMLHGREAIIPLDKMRLPASRGRDVNVMIQQAPWQTLQDRREMAKMINREVRRALRHDPATMYDARVAVNGGR